MRGTQPDVTGDRTSGGIVAEEARLGRGPRPIASTLDRLIARSGHRRGFGEAGLLVDWMSIVGERIGQCTAPERLARGRGGEPGTLHLRVQPGWATEIQHLAPMILEKINGYLGYEAARRLVLKQGTAGAPQRRPVQPPPLGQAEQDRLAAALSEVGDPELAAALRDLGRAVLHSRSTPKA